MESFQFTIWPFKMQCTAAGWFAHALLSNTGQRKHRESVGRWCHLLDVYSKCQTAKRSTLTMLDWTLLPFLEPLS